MEFTSFLFFILLAIVLLGIQILPKGRPLIMFYTVMSYLFYANAYLPYVILLFSTTVFNYALSKKLLNTETEPRRFKRRFFLVTGIVINASLLAVFKYSAFIINNINSFFDLLHIHFILPIPSILFPLGISFYTFIILSYLIDVYRGTAVRANNFLEFSFFVAFFPYILSGPIIRASEFFPQIGKDNPLDRQTTIKGIELMLLGYFKKCVIADNCAAYVDPVYANPANYGGGCIWLATFFFTVQIYCDFSGYIDIARGVGKILGFNLPVNFRWPYFSNSIREFWRRWNITLSFWIRDYIYFPLGGSKVGSVRYLFNLFVTWFLCGLWHGPQYKYILWGLYNGFFIAIDHYINQHKSKHSDRRSVARYMMVLFTFIITLIGWMLFRCNEIADAFIMIKKMMNPLDKRLLQGGNIFLGIPILSVLILPIIHFVTYRLNYDVDTVSMLNKISFPARVLIVSFSIIIIVLFMGERQQFIYLGF